MKIAMACALLSPPVFYILENNVDCGLSGTGSNPSSHYV
jgi:hypothetical protein